MLVAVLIPIAALLLIMNLSQTELLFPTHAVAQAGTLPPGAERWEIETTDQERIRGVHIPPARPGSPTRLILGFGGNGWNGQHVAEFLAGLFPEAHVVAFHYRGYKPSTGSPSAKALTDDAPLILDEAVRRIEPEQVIAAGFSIGSGVAANLARHRSVNGLILVTPFDSLKAVAGDLFPWLPIGPIFQHELATADDLQGSAVPVAIVGAQNDEIVDPRRTEALRRRVPNLVYDRTIASAGHNDLYQRADFETAMGEAFDAIIAAKK